MTALSLLLSAGRRDEPRRDRVRHSARSQPAEGVRGAEAVRREHPSRPVVVFTSGRGGADKVERNVGDHVFLAADEAAPADFDEDAAGVEPVGLGSSLGVAEEAGIDPA